MNYFFRVKGSNSESNGTEIGIIWKLSSDFGSKGTE